MMKTTQDRWTQQPDDSCLFSNISACPPTCCSSHLDDVMAAPARAPSRPSPVSGNPPPSPPSIGDVRRPSRGSGARHSPLGVVGRKQPALPSFPLDRAAVSPGAPHAEHRPPSLALRLLNRRHIGCWKQQRPRQRRSPSPWWRVRVRRASTVICF